MSLSMIIMDHAVPELDQDEKYAFHLENLT